MVSLCGGLLAAAESETGHQTSGSSLFRITCLLGFAILRHFSDRSDTAMPTQPRDPLTLDETRRLRAIKDRDGLGWQALAERVWSASADAADGIPSSR